MANEFNIAQKTSSNGYLPPTAANVIAQSIIETIAVPSLNLGIAGFTDFAKEGEELSLESTITDLYVEDNTALQQGMSNKPLQVTIRGIVSDLQFQFAQSTTTQIAQGVEKLTVAAAFLPTLSAAEQAKRDAVESARIGDDPYEIYSNTLNPSYNLYTLFQNAATALTTDGRFFQFFKALRDAKVPFSVDTRWGFFNDMLLESLRPASINGVTNASAFEMKFKQVRFASTQTVPFDASNYESQAALQNQPIKQNGINNTEDVPQNEASSLLSEVANYLFNG
jgi:hypothetical protein